MQCRSYLIALTFLTTTERPQMSLDKLIAAATDYFSTGAEVHRRALAGGGGKITDFSDKSGHFGTPTTATADVVSATKKVAAKATKPAVTEQTGADDAMAAEAAERAATAAREAEAKAAAKAKAKAKAIEDENARVAAAEAAAMFGPEDDIPDFKIDAISYEEDIRPLIRTKSLANRDALVALLGKFNVKSGQELTADQYPAFLVGLKAI
jgi:hypothetical protein